MFINFDRRKYYKSTKNYGHHFYFYLAIYISEARIKYIQRQKVSFLFEIISNIDIISIFEFHLNFIFIILEFLIQESNNNLLKRVELMIIFNLAHSLFFLTYKKQ